MGSIRLPQGAWLDRGVVRVKRHGWQGLLCSSLMLMISATAVLATYAAPARTFTPGASHRTVTIRAQETDSCQQAVGTGLLTLTGNRQNVQVTASGTIKPKTIAFQYGHCPLQHGNCPAVGGKGCASWVVPVPSSGTAIYKISVTRPPVTNSECLGGSACSTPQVATVTISSTGSIAATTLNTYPNGSTGTFPSAGTFAGVPGDPIMFHLSKLGSLNCDGDHDADDHMTGSEGNNPRCDNEQDRHAARSV
jgi:hypothetical protein